MAQKTLAPARPDPEEEARVKADLHYNHLKNSGELKRREIERAIQQERKWSYPL